MISKKELLRNIIGEKIIIDYVKGTYEKGGVLGIFTKVPDNAKYYYIISEIGDDVFEVTFYPQYGDPFKKYYSIHHVAEIT